MYTIDLKKELLEEHAIESLLLNKNQSKNTLLNKNQSMNTMDSYYFFEIIQELYNNPKNNEKKILEIEYLYLSLFSKFNRPKLLEKKLSEEPDFFVDIISSDSKKNTQILEKLRFNSFWRRPPGTLDDGSFSEKKLQSWYNKVKEKTKETRYFQSAMGYLGKVLFFSKEDPNGLWINIAVAKILDEEKDIREGFCNEILYPGGVYTSDNSGKSEKKVADLWKNRADIVEQEGLIHFAESLKKVAKEYEITS